MQLDMTKVYDSSLGLGAQQDGNSTDSLGNAKFQGVVWTAGMKRLYTLLER